MMEGVFRLRSDRLAEADSVLRRALALDPQNWVAHIILSYVVLKSGNPSAAVAHMEAAHRLKDPDDPFTLSGLAEIYGEVGDTAKARGIVTRLKKISKERYVQRAALASALVAVHDTAGVLENLEASADLREADFLMALESARGLSSHPRFRELLRRSKLDSYFLAAPRH
jgi:predicted Zn-dependent protease